MHNYRLFELLDMSLIRRLAESNFRASGIPLSIIDAVDASILVRAGWTDICMKFHRAVPASNQRCLESGVLIGDRLVEGEAVRSKCKNGLWHMAIPIIVAKQHLATMYLAQFYFEGEVPEREYFINQGREFGYDMNAYLAALDQIPIFSVEKVNWIIEYDKALVRFIADLAEHSIEALEAKKILTESEKKYRTLVTNLNIGVFRISPEGRFIQANPAMATIFGYGSAEELMAEDIVHLYQDPADRHKLIEDLFRNGNLKDRELAMRRRDGTPIWCSTTVTLQHGERGEEISWLEGVIEDVTERRQAEELVLTINENLERKVKERTRELQESQIQYMHAEKLSSIGQLSASIAHEFNNPLQGILSILNGLKKRAILEEEDKELLDAAIVEGNRIKDLIRSLQDFNRPSSGRKTMMDVQHALESILILQKSDLNGRRISVERNYAHNLPQILAVSDQMKQVFLNLLTNAADACHECGGVVTVSTRQENDRVAVAIQDTGVGIKPSEMEHIFRPFFSTKSEVKGTGLGLSVSYGIVKKHQGEIRVESQPGEGATFTVLLPIKGVEEAVPAIDKEVF